MAALEAEPAGSLVPEEEMTLRDRQPSGSNLGAWGADSDDFDGSLPKIPEPTDASLDQQLESQLDGDGNKTPNTVNSGEPPSAQATPPTIIERQALENYAAFHKKPVSEVTLHDVEGSSGLRCDHYICTHEFNACVRA